jgi:hypothetical protein
MRYCGVADPECRYCEGTGRIIGGDIEGVNPIVVLRAALMALDTKTDRAVLLEKGLLASTADDAVAVSVPWSAGERSALGHQARQLLVDLGLHHRKPRKVLTPADRAEAKRAKAAKKESDRLMIEAMNRRMDERSAERRRLKIERAAAEAVALAHPDELAQEREAQQVFVALDEGFGVWDYTAPSAARRQP